MKDSDNTLNNGDIDNADVGDPTSSENNEGITNYFILYGGYCVPAALYNDVLHQVVEVIPALESDEKYTLEDLSGKEFWDPLSDGKRRLAGICMSHMVKNALLPLRVAYSVHEYPKRYQLI